MEARSREGWRVFLREGSEDEENEVNVTESDDGG